MYKFSFLLFCIILFILPVWAAPNYATIDTIAKEAKPLKDATELEFFTKRLTRSFKTEEEKARAILAWIVYNIDYDFYRAEHDPQPDAQMALDIKINPKTRRPYIAGADVVALNEDPNAITKTITTRLGLCKDLARLYQKMGQYAGLEVSTIEGFVCDPLTPFSGHMWNAVKINGTWKYVDPTWAILEKRPSRQKTAPISAAMKQKEYEKAVSQRAKRYSPVKKSRDNRVVLDDWFLTNEDQMIETHFPLERRWQLQKTRVVFEDFLKQRCGMTLEDFLASTNPH